MLQILDTTLRDGAQCEGITFSCEDKLNITKELDNLGISWIEAGNPGSNPKDRSYFKRVTSECKLKNAKLIAFGSTIKPGSTPEQDSSLLILSECQASVKTIFGKSSLQQVKNVLHCEPAENLRIIYETIIFLRSKNNTVWYDAEHFFDAYKENPEYALKTLLTAEQAGAEVITLCDTRGGTLPNDIFTIVKEVRQTITVPLGIHCHNDCGLAVACTIAAVQGGCSHIEGTIGGIGERCGNADLCTLIPLISLKLQIQCLPESSLSKLTHVYRTIIEIMNMTPFQRSPFVGQSAFAHKGGMHIDAVIKENSSYEIIQPQSVGNQRRFLISDQSGRAGVLARLDNILPDLNPNSAQIRFVMEQLKRKEAEGYTYENADGSFALLVLDSIGRRPHFYSVVDFHVLCNQAIPLSYSESNICRASSQAYLKVLVNGQDGINAAEGDGPVNALDLALRKTLSQFYPALKKMHLNDFKVRVLNSQGTASRVRVNIESTDGKHIWNTVGVSEDIIRACLSALIDSIDYMLTFYNI